MPAFLVFDRISAARPDGTPLFSDLTLSLGRESVGLVGRNGSGKSTLLAIAAGQRHPAAGEVTLHGRVGFLRQIQPHTGSVASVLGIGESLDAMRRLEAGKGTVDDAALADWTLPERLDAALADAGLAGLDCTRGVDSLSGGERTRLAMAALALEAPDVLLLDEPTNNLDREGRDAVLHMLRHWPGGALVASHDRELLEAMDRIVSLSPVGVTVHGGGWGEFVAARDEARRRADAELDRARRTERQQSRTARKREEAQARRDRTGRARRERGSEPKILLGALKRRAEESAGALEKLAERQAQEARAAVDAARANVEVVTPLSIELPPSGLPSGRTLLSLRDVTLDRDGRRILGPVSLEITGPERVAVNGPNGSGKTSLLRIALREIVPDSGEAFRAAGGIAMLDQHAAALNPSASLLETMMARHPALDRRGAHAALARLAFRNRDAERNAGTLSGGERVRAALALACSGPAMPQLLVLDEPTNHLDLEAIEELERALRGYDGALLVVSHDAAFLENLGITKQIELAEE